MASPSLVPPPKTGRAAAVAGKVTARTAARPAAREYRLEDMQHLLVPAGDPMGTTLAAPGPGRIGRSPDPACPERPIPGGSGVGLEGRRGRRGGRGRRRGGGRGQG